MEKTQVIVGLGSCGIAAGAKKTYDTIQNIMQIDNLDFELKKTSCVGMCFREPLVEVIDDTGYFLYGGIDEAKALEIIERHVQHHEPVKEYIVKSDLFQTKDDSYFAGQVKIALRNCGFIDPEKIEDAEEKGAYKALQKIANEGVTREAVIQTVLDSGIRGRGGGGFPTGMKWKFAYNSPGDEKYIICNADEGDPGAFMDRSILEGDPHSVLEAMAICGYTMGSDEGIIYIRAEYPLAIERLHVAIKQAREYGLLGKDILGTGFDFDITLRYGAGAFVCGEETALIHSMEGHRGEPTVKPPFPAESGYNGKPTNVNNVETFANIPAIILKGAEWFSSIGTEKSKGTKVFALAGKINNVGLIEVPMGTTLREVIFEIGGGIKDGKKFKAVQTGGPSGGCLTEKHLDTPIDFDNLIAAGSMMGSGGMIVMDEDDCMVAMAKFYLEFTVEESCGKCAPCRIGNKRLHETLHKITEGKGTMHDLELLKNMSNVIKDTSLCGLGQTSPNPVLSMLDNFYNEFLAHVSDHKCEAGQCKSLLKYNIIEEECVGCTACARVCPVGCISGEKKEVHIIDQSICIKCGACMDKCKFNAIELI